METKTQVASVGVGAEPIQETLQCTIGKIISKKVLFHMSSSLSWLYG